MSLHIIEKAPPRPAVLTIAGFDPSSGAGVTADLKVFAAYRLYGLAAITALTVQSTQGVRQSRPARPEFLADTLNCLADDIEIAGVKIGMLATGDIVSIAARFLTERNIPRERVVLDPILRSSSGSFLLGSAGFARISSQLLPATGWVTPNIDELAMLTGIDVSGRESMAVAAAALAESQPGLNVVATGGHLDPPDDFLWSSEGVEHWFAGTKIETTATHGTGCTFSSALLAELVAGAPAVEAVAGAKRYVRAAMEAAYPVGKGRGPLHHLYRLDEI